MINLFFFFLLHLAEFLRWDLNVHWNEQGLAFGSFFFFNIDIF